MREVTSEIDDDAYEHFNTQAEVCNRSVEYIIALAVWNYFKMEIEGEI